jgi:hypothetical protein
LLSGSLLNSHIVSGKGDLTVQANCFRQRGLGHSGDGLESVTTHLPEGVTWDYDVTAETAILIILSRKDILSYDPSA